MPDSGAYARKVGIAALLVALIAILAIGAWLIVPVLLVGFAAILYAVFLSGAAGWLASTLRIRYPVALVTTIAVLLALSAGVGLLIGPRIASEIDRLVEVFPAAVQELESWIGHYRWGRALLESADGALDVGAVSGGLLGRVAGVFSTAAGLVTNLVVIVIVGIYLAAEPARYRELVIRLVPPARRQRARELFCAIGSALQRWLVGRLASMAAVGVLTAAGLWLLGVRLPLVLGALAAVLSFVPYLGPLASLVPAVMLALLDSPALAGYTALLYLGIQALESYLITPLIDQRAVSLPPPFLIMAQLGLGVLLGLAGVVVATPLIVVVVVTIQLLYIEDVLGEPVTPLGASPRDD